MIYLKNNFFKSCLQTIPKHQIEYTMIGYTTVDSFVIPKTVLMDLITKLLLLKCWTKILKNLREYIFKLLWHLITER